MLYEMIPVADYLIRMRDGTIKQINPFTGTEVWTVPGRGHRPLGDDAKRGVALDPAKDGLHCAFCHGRVFETPPEKARLVRTPAGWETVKGITAEQHTASGWMFRRVPNLFEIVSCEYWEKNYRYVLSPQLQARKRAYLATEQGQRHVLDVIDNRMRFSGVDEQTIRATPVEDKLTMANAFFGGGHELIIAHQHFVPGATHDNQLASSGTMTPEDHYHYFHFTIEALRDIYLSNRYVRYVAVFQNWLKPAGASFDHLHKQLVAIDERGVSNDMEIRLVRSNPNIYNEEGVNYAGHRNLVFAENDYAIAFAGFGHRFPTLEIYSKSERSQPWNHSAEELRGISDLVHACHAAMGPGIPCNEEWHYKPPDADVPMPWRVLIKWRVSNPAGFEGGTLIYVNTIDPESLRDRMVPRLFQLKGEGRIASMKIAFECDCVPNCLKYNPAVRSQYTREAEFAPLSGDARSMS